MIFAPCRRLYVLTHIASIVEMYVSPSSSLAATSTTPGQWQPVVAFIFAADHTDNDDLRGISQYFESFAACHWSPSVDVIFPRKDVRLPLSYNGTACGRENFVFPAQDVTVQRNTSFQLAARLLDRVKLINALTPARIRHIHLLTNVRCNNTEYYYDLSTHNAGALLANNVTFRILWQTTEKNVDRCKIITAVNNIEIIFYSSTNEFKNAVPKNCYASSVPSQPAVPSWAIACIVSVVALAVSTGFYAVYRIRTRKHRKDSLSAEYVVEEDNAIVDPLCIRDAELTMSSADIIGTGAFANVYSGLLCRPQCSDTIAVAVKVIRQLHGDKTQHTMQEIELMRSLGFHPHIVGFYGYAKATAGFHLVLELCENGDLLHYLKQTHESCKGTNSCAKKISVGSNFEFLLRIAWEISDGMVFLSSRRYIHRDLAARNILLTAAMTAKISDFGLCRYTDEELYTAKSERKLPWKWMALESLRNVEFSTQSDVWSFGILLHEVFSAGSAPYSDVADQHELLMLLDSGRRLAQPAHSSDELYNLMRLCWQEDAKDRPTFYDVRSRVCLMRSQTVDDSLRKGKD